IQTELIAIWHLIAAAFAGGVTLAFNIPARQAFLMDLVGKKDLTNAIALNSVTMNVCRIASPALAGVLIKLLDIPGVYWIIVCSNLISLCFLVAIPGRGKIKLQSQVPLIRNIKDGLLYVRTNRIIFTLLVIAFVPILVAMPYQMLLPVFAKSVFHAGETGLGLLMSSVGVGALLGSSAVAILSNYRQKGLLMLGAGSVFGVFLVLFANASSLWIASICLLFVGSGSAMFMILTNSLIMENTPEAYVGRVMSLFVMTFGLMPLAVLPAGGLAEFVGAPLVVSGGGVILFLVIGGVYLGRSDIRQLK
ncbi:MAG: MFS transporter, partial [Deltaproteobacteria bacterium]|nr:MFS transporter [Deltaproteobacteria bacterium]